MAWEWVAQLAPSLATIGAASVGLARGQGKLRRNMRHDADMLKELPADSEAHRKVLAHLAWQTDELIKQESAGAGRDLFSISLGLFLSLGFGYLTIWLIGKGGWWWAAAPLAATMALVGLVGLAEGIALKVRPTKEEKEAERQRKREEKAAMKVDRQSRGK